MRVAFIVQRCGREVNGGAETHCLQMAQRMAAYWQTEVLTTCALDYMTWENWYPVGTEQIEDAFVRRFPVDQPRDVPRFNRLSSDLRAKQPQTGLAEEENWMRAQGPLSTALLGYLKKNKDQYDAFIFFGYLYATTYFGLPLVREKAYLAALAHDEWTIHLAMWDKLFALPRALIFNSIEEKKFLRRRFPSLRLTGPVTGVGLQRRGKIDMDRFRQKYNLKEPFLLYVGRIDSSKGCDELCDWFIRLRAEETGLRKLVFIGKEVMPIPYHCDIIHLGFVSEEEKWDAMAACDWLVNPSSYESLSIVLLETWLAERPAVVNGHCDVLVGHCRRSHGGLWYRDFEEWKTILSIVDDRTKEALGLQGRRYVEKRYSWKRVETEYLDLIPARRFQAGDKLVPA